MEHKYTVKLKTLVEELSLTVISAAENYDEVLICTPDVNRPGLMLSGFSDYFNPERIQIIGKMETTYMRRFSHLERLRRFDQLMGSGISTVVVCHQEEPLPECIQMAQKHNVTLLSTDIDTSRFMARVIGSLTLHLAPRITMHGVMVEVHGEGLLITGDSGIGKSETALELVKRGHKLIADDAVEVKRTSRITLVGSAPEMIRYYMEVRGIGIIDTRNIFGIGAVKPSTRIDLVVNLKLWDEKMSYDRLGLETQYTSILDVEVPCTTIPVLPGRNLAVILEIAAINNRQKKMGYNAARTLAERHDKSIDSGWMSL
jgi:HPr kinase/phosphorylase